MAGNDDARLVVGWREWCALPDLGISRIKVKIDTGARTSALHASGIEPFEREGKPWLRFSVHPIQKNTQHTAEAEAPLVDERWVRSSSGESSFRPVIATRLVIGSLVWKVEVTLERRDFMGYRMLLGRQALRRRVYVDAGSSFLAGAPRELTSRERLKGPGRKR